MKILSAVLALALPMVVMPCGAAQAQTPSAKGGQRTVTCREGANLMEFAFDGTAQARLTRIEGDDINRFPDLHEPEWTVRVVVENGVPMFRITNARGALLSMFVPTPGRAETVGQMTWNNPQNARIDLLCDLSAPLR